jgi:CobQ-like glutamine amidotransferase family enzyme
VKLTIAHLYPDYLNIYADRGNLAVLTERSRLRGIDISVVSVGIGEPTPVEEIDLYYVGGGQDREQAVVAPDLAARGEVLREAISAGRVLLAVCGGYQLLGRYYRDRSGRDQRGAGVFPLKTVAGERRLIGDVLIECELESGVRRTVAGFENHAGRTLLDAGAGAFGRVVAGFGNDGESGYEGCRIVNAIGTYLHGPLLPRNPWLADWLILRAAEFRTGEPATLAELPDSLERQAHTVAAARARSRGGRR